LIITKQKVSIDLNSQIAIKISGS